MSVLFSIGLALTVVGCLSIAAICFFGVHRLSDQAWTGALDLSGVTALIGLALVILAVKVVGV